MLQLFSWHSKNEEQHQITVQDRGLLITEDPITEELRQRGSLFRLPMLLLPIIGLLFPSLLLCSKSKAFFPVMTILTITLIVLFDLLISWNNFDRFFIMLGVELILAAVIWIAGLVLSLGKDSVSDEGGAE